MRRFYLILLPLLLFQPAYSESVIGIYPGELGADLAGHPELRVDHSGASVLPVPSYFREASLFSYARGELQYFEEADDRFEERATIVDVVFDSTRPRHPEAPEQTEAGELNFDGLSEKPFWRERMWPLVVRRLATGDEDAFAVSLRFGGVLTSKDGESFDHWDDLPPRFMPAEYRGPLIHRDVLDLWQNPANPQEIIAINKHQALFSKDGGRSFAAHDLPRLMRAVTLASVTARVVDGKIRDIYFGSYLRGMFRCRMSQENPVSACASFRRGLPALHDQDGNYFIEALPSVVYSEGAEQLMAVTQFQPSIALWNDTTGVWQRIDIPGMQGYDMARSLYVTAEGRQAFVATTRGIYVYDFDREAWGYISEQSLDLPPGYENAILIPRSGDGHIAFARDTQPRSRAPTNIRAFYVSPTSARSKQHQVFQLLDRYNFNAVVIDVKDDFGRLVYGSNLPEATAMRNTRELAPLRDLVRKLKDRGVYVIARQVVFKDARLFNYNGHRYAIQDRYTRGPWTYEEIERWVDTYSEWVHNYNLRVSKEVLGLGFDEIQYDYIRFPSDGPIGRCHWRYRRQNAYRSEALEAFLMKASHVSNRPISIDIYGYHGIYRAGTVIGQDMIDMGEFVDVVSPMHYSSHFGNNYLDHIQPREQRTYALLKLGSERPVAQSQGRFAVRPWMQSFRMKIGLWGWGVPYMDSQIRGAMDGGATGFLWWGPIDEFHLPGRAQEDLFAPTR